MPKGPKPISVDTWRAQFTHDARSLSGLPIEYHPPDLIALSQPITAVCPDHGEYVRTASAHRKLGCIKCNRMRGTEYTKSLYLNQSTSPKPKQSYTLKTLYAAMKKAGVRQAFDGALYSVRLPSSTVFLDTLIDVVCPHHGTRTVTVSQAIKHRCSKCSRLLQAPRVFTPPNSLFPCSRSEFLSLIKHSACDRLGAADKLKVPKEVFRDTEIRVLCNSHGEFIRTAGRYVNYRGCRSCQSQAATASNLGRSRDDWLAARDSSGTCSDGRPVKYHNLPDNIPSTLRIQATCPIHGRFEQIAFYHLLMKGFSCPVCNSNRSGPSALPIPKNLAVRVESGSLLSRSELRLLELLHARLPTDAVITLQHTPFEDKRVSLDLFIPKYQVAVEVNGVYCTQTRTAITLRSIRKKPSRVKSRALRSYRLRTLT